jgi:AcrR family transcriptional regulator
MFLMENPVNLARRDAAATRERLIAAAFEEIYRTGFQGSDINSILTRAGLTKGALYHHFGSKEALGHAVIEQLIAGVMTAKWLAPLDDTDDPIGALIGVVEGTSLQDAHVTGGCPLNNLAQEMSPIDEGFRMRLSHIFTGWIGGIADALRPWAGQWRSAPGYRSPGMRHLRGRHL